MNQRQGTVGQDGPEEAIVSETIVERHALDTLPKLREGSECVGASLQGQAFSDVGNPFMFQGRPHFAIATQSDDEAATFMLNDHRNRFEEPVIGRWLTRDPVSYCPERWNQFIDINPIRVSDITTLYCFLQSNAMRSYDPTGLASPVVGAAGVALFGFAACTIPISLDVQSELGKSWTNDRYAHCLASCRIAKLCSRAVSWVAGAGKELKDEVHSHFGTASVGWDQDDMCANSDGRDCAGASSVFPVIGIVTGLFGDSCSTCCASKHPPFGPPAPCRPHRQPPACADPRLIAEIERALQGEPPSGNPFRFRRNDPMAVIWDESTRRRARM